MTHRLLISFAALTSVALTGCQHSPKVVQAATVPAAATAPAVQVPPPSVLKEQADAMAKMQAQTPPPEPKPEEPAPTQRPERRRSSAQTQAPKPATPAPPTQTANAAPAAPSPEAVIGQLSTGGDASAQNKKQAEDYLAGLQRRVDGLSASVVRDRKSAIEQVRDFLRKATDALHSGDVEGANNLATKAKLILDDIKG